MTRPALVLVGPPGAGKSTVGRAVARRLDLAFRDTDADVETAAGKPISEVFIDDGEAHFRALERDAVARALQEHEGVLSLGGGAVLDHGTRRLLADQVVVLLDVDLSAAATRVGMGQGRPLIGLNPRAQLRQLLQERRPLYVDVARHVVDTSALTPMQVVEQVVALASRP